MALDRLYIGNDNIVTVDVLRNISTSPEAYINTATVTGTLYDMNGDAVTTVTFDYVLDSNGKYTATIPDTVTSTLSVNRRYKLRIQANGGAGLQGEWDENYQAIRR